MAFATWMRALSAVGTVAEATRFFRGSSEPPEQQPATVDAAGTLETRLVNVLVAALREAFDRDRARCDLERDFHDAERARKERELRLEWLRETATYALTQTRYLAVLSISVWVASVAAAGWLAPLESAPKVLLILGWAGLSSAVAAAFVTHQQMTAWLGRAVLSRHTGTEAELPPTPSGLPELPGFTAQSALPWLFLGGFMVTATSLVLAL